MVTDLQKASLWKRMSAGLFDVILLIMLAVGMATLLSWVCGYDAQKQAYDNVCASYEAQYDVTFQITQEQYEGFSEAERQAYDTAYDALIADQDLWHFAGGGGPGTGGALAVQERTDPWKEDLWCGSDASRWSEGQYLPDVCSDGAW